MSMFADRADAGRKLAKAMQGMHFENPLVLAIPRGGVITGIELAKSLDADLDVSIPPTKVGGFTASQPTAFTEG